MIVYNGSTGGLGRYLAPALARRGLPSIALRSRLEDTSGLRRELANLATPDREITLLQLAARVSVPACEADPEGTFDVNVTQTIATVEAFSGWAQEAGLEARVAYVSSGHVYAAAAPGTAIDEQSPLGPRSVYARSKLRAEEELRRFAAQRGFGLVIARVFGLVAPQQPPNYVLPGLIRRVRQRQLGGIPGLSYVRDYLDARDVCDDLLALAQAQTSLEDGDTRAVNVCSGEGITLRDLLLEVVRAVRPGDEGALLAETSEAPGRPDDVPWIVGDPSRFIALTSQAPRRLSPRDTIRDALAAD